MSKGYFVFAQGKEYIRMAYALALSIKNTQDINSVCVAIGEKDTVPTEYAKVFDYVVRVRNVGLKHPMANEWQIWDLTPYKETIHVEADMLFTTNIDWWWQDLQTHDLFFTSKVYDYRGHVAKSNFYRKHFDKMNLPKLYNGLYRSLTQIGRSGKRFVISIAILPPPKNGSRYSVISTGNH